MPKTTTFTEAEVGQLRITLLRIVRTIRSQYRGDVTPSQLAVLSSLLRHGACTVGEIAAHEHVQPPSASRIVAVLEQRGLVSRAVDPDDRRCARVQLSPEGQAYVDELRTSSTSWLAERIDTLDPTEAAALKAALPALEHLLHSSDE